MPIAVRCLLILSLCLVAVPPGAAQESLCPASLVYITEEYPPYNYTDKGRLTGVSVNTLKLIWQEMGVPERPIEVLPWARAYYRVQTESNAVVFSAFKTVDREPLFKWVGPIANGQISIFTLQKNDFPIEEFNNLSRYRIGTIRNFPATPLLEKTGFDITIHANMEGGIKMLESDRIDLLAMDDHSFYSTISTMGYPADHFKRVWCLCRGSLYFIFNKNIPDTLVTRFQNALDSVKQTPAYRNRVNRCLD